MPVSVVRVEGLEFRPRGDVNKKTGFTTGLCGAGGGTRTHMPRGVRS